VSGVSACGAFALTLCLSACATTTPSAVPQIVDVLDYVIGDSLLWPRVGNQNQNQIVGDHQVCWTKYSLGWMYECWRFDDSFVYHSVDHGVDRRPWEFYKLADGRWLPRRLARGDVWSLDVADSITWFTTECDSLPSQPFTYRVRAWLEGARDVGGDLGIRDTLTLEYAPSYPAPASSVEQFHFARGAGWYEWTRGDGARVTFNHVGGVSRLPTPLCRRDFQQ